MITASFTGRVAWVGLSLLTGSRWRLLAPPCPPQGLPDAGHFQVASPVEVSKRVASSVVTPWLMSRGPFPG